MQELYRNIPSMHQLLEQEMMVHYKNNVERDTLKKWLNEGISHMKKAIREGEQGITLRYGSKEQVMIQLKSHLDTCLLKDQKKRIQSVINATGTVLHTNLGRAPLPKQVGDSIQDIASGYCNLEYDIEKGKRGSRYDAVESQLCQLTGAQAAMVVNNNAAAVFLSLHALAKGKKVIVSRSEQVEIGGSFRIPEIIEESGAIMVEVGTTNKTYLRDFQKVMDEETAILLKVHKSNYRIEGFTAEVKGEDMVDLVKGQKENSPIVMEDVGSGVLVDLRDYGLPYEPTVSSLIQKGIDLVTFSGDKLLGGPQAGILVGKKELIQKIKEDQLTRMVRIDKLSLIALQEVLNLYMQKSQKAYRALPIMDMLMISKEELQIKGEKLQKQLAEEGVTYETHLVSCQDQPGGGSLPTTVLDGMAVAIHCGDEDAAGKMLIALRHEEIPIIARIKEEFVLLSLRTLREEDSMIISKALKMYQMKGMA